MRVEDEVRWYSRDLQCCGTSTYAPNLFLESAAHGRLWPLLRHMRVLVPNLVRSVHATLPKSRDEKVFAKLTSEEALSLIELIHVDVRSTTRSPLCVYLFYLQERPWYEQSEHVCIQFVDPYATTKRRY